MASTEPENIPMKGIFRKEEIHVGPLLLEMTKFFLFFSSEINDVKFGRTIMDIEFAKMLSENSSSRHLLCSSQKMAIETFGKRFLKTRTSLIYRSSGHSRVELPENGKTAIC